jgi:hypothetical protein
MSDRNTIIQKVLEDLKKVREEVRKSIPDDPNPPPELPDSLNQTYKTASLLLFSRGMDKSESN